MWSSSVGSMIRWLDAVTRVTVRLKDICQVPRPIKCLLYSVPIFIYLFYALVLTGGGSVKIHWACSCIGPSTPSRLYSLLESVSHATRWLENE